MIGIRPEEKPKELEDQEWWSRLFNDVVDESNYEDTRLH
jgi:hypothetical protein